MNRKVISAAVAVAMTATMSSFALPANAAEVKLRNIKQTHVKWKSLIVD